MEREIRKYIDGIASPTRRRDAETMLELMRRATREEPTLWGTIVGYGAYHYKYASGREGDAASRISPPTTSTSWKPSSPVRTPRSRKWCSRTGLARTAREQPGR